MKKKTFSELLGLGLTIGQAFGLSLRSSIEDQQRMLRIINHRQGPGVTRATLRRDEGRSVYKAHTKTADGRILSSWV